VAITNTILQKDIEMRDQILHTTVETQIGLPHEAAQMGLKE
jgi:hypothetical protein